MDYVVPLGDRRCPKVGSCRHYRGSTGSIGPRRVCGGGPSCLLDGFGSSLDGPNHHSGGVNGHS